MSHRPTEEASKTTSRRRGGESLRGCGGKQAGGLSPSGRVLFVITQTGHRANGGLESVTQLLRNLKGIECAILTHAESSYTARWRELGRDVHVREDLWACMALRGGSVRSTKRLARALRANLGMWRLLAREGTQVVHFNDIQAFLAMGVGARLAGRKVVLNIRNVKEDGSYGLHWHLARVLTHRMVLLSHDMARRFEERLGGRALGRKLEVVYSGVDISHVRSASLLGPDSLRGRLEADDSVVALGYVGAVTPQKGQLAFIEKTLPGLGASTRPWHVYFLGDHDPDSDPYSRQCEEAVARLGLGEHVTFVGFVEDISAWYEAFDMVVLASQREGLARSMIESITSGAPVVSFDVASAREVLEAHSCGLVVEDRDHTALAQGVRGLIDNPGRRRALGDRGRQIGRALFDPAASAEGYARIYRSLVV